MTSHPVCIFLVYNVVNSSVEIVSDCVVSLDQSKLRTLYPENRIEKRDFDTFS